MNTQNGNLVLFLQETLQRFFTKSPKYFVVLQFLSIIALVITGLPELLEQSGVVLPPFLAFLASPMVIKIAGVILIMSKLPTQSKAAGVLDDGSIVKVTDTKSLPFTAVAENKAAEIANVQPMEITVK